MRQQGRQYGINPLIAARALARAAMAGFLGALQIATSPPPAVAQEGAWMYDIFVQKCRAAGGTPRSSLDQFNRGEKFQCDQGASGRSTGDARGCQTQAKINIDWVFSDKGALATYKRGREAGQSALDAVLGAQAHNPRAQKSIQDCGAWAQNYLTAKGAPATADQRNNRSVGATDCSCISIVPVGERRAYSVTNRCAQLNVSVLFGGDIARLSPSNDALSNWTRSVSVGPARSDEVIAPDGWTIVSINAYRISAGANSFVCRML